MIAAMRHARDHLDSHVERLRPGVTIRELTHGGHVLAPEFHKQKCSCKMHGVGLCDEWPSVPYPADWVDGAFEAALQPGMVLCIEALASPAGGDFSIKLEDQVLITATGAENLTLYPLDPALRASDRAGAGVLGREATTEGESVKRHRLRIRVSLEAHATSHQTLWIYIIPIRPLTSVMMSSTARRRGVMACVE
jgi:hypothetical protein